MKLIFSYLKKYLIFVLIIVGLTYIQVQTELALPDYMSDIVTNGIQYGGITEEIPNVICEKDMNNIILFMSENDANTVLNNYHFINNGTKATIDNQEIEFKTNVYIFNNNTDEVSNKLLKPLVYNYALKQANISVNKDNVEEVKKKLDQQLIGLEDNYSSIVKVEIQSIYSDVGMNIETIQTNYILHVGMIMLGISLLSVGVQLASTYMATKIAGGFIPVLTTSAAASPKVVIKVLWLGRVPQRTTAAGVSAGRPLAISCLLIFSMFSK